MTIKRIGGRRLNCKRTHGGGLSCRPAPKCRGGQRRNKRTGRCSKRTKRAGGRKRRSSAQKRASWERRIHAYHKARERSASRGETMYGPWGGSKMFAP